MNNTKIKLWQILPTVIVAFIAGYFFKWLTKDHSITDAEMAIWLGAFGTICAIVGAFVLGERQIHVLWRANRESDEQCLSKKRASFLAMATAASVAMERLEDRYRNSYEDRLRIRAAYHGDSFASLIEALAVMPMHELESVEAAVALAGLKKNMLAAQRIIDPFVALKNQFCEALTSSAETSGIDLRKCKACAASHYETLVQVLKPQS